MRTEEKRRCLYAALMRYAPESGSLRGRALDQIVLGGLLGSSEEDPYKLGTVRENIKDGYSSLEIRDEAIRASIETLISEEKVLKGELRKKTAYFLSEAGYSSVEEITGSAKEVFDPVLEKFLSGLDEHCDKEVGTSVFVEFVSSCFAKFGHKLARSIIGDVSGIAVLETLNVRGLFSDVIEKYGVKPEAADLLFAKCSEFLKSKERDSEELKFRLTQGYYVAQLLGVETDKFDPIASDAYKGAIFYLDTNVIVPKVIKSSDSDLFDETVALARRFDIELRVTRATIDEARNLSQDRINDLDQILQVEVPDVLSVKVKDEIYESFLKAKATDNSLTPEAFLEELSDISGLLTSNDITIDDRDTDAIIGGRNVERLAKLFDESAIATRGWGKGRNVQLHDVANYLAVEEERSSGNNEVWFLSKDRTLEKAAQKLSDGSLPFNLMLIGFLQSISPFVQATEERNVLVDLFSDLLTKEFQGFPNGKIFDIKELRIISELHEDILSTPAEQLVLAFDFIKGHVLRGKAYREEDHPRVALELKKFLSSSTDEKFVALKKEIDEQATLVEKERLRRQKEMEESLKREADSKEAISGLKSEKEGIISENGSLLAKRSRANVSIAIMGMLLSVFFWSFSTEISAAILLKYTEFGVSPEAFKLLIDGFSSVLFFGSMLPGVLQLSSSVSNFALTFVIAIAVYKCGFFSIDAINNSVSYVSVASPFALAMLLMFKKES